MGDDHAVFHDERAKIERHGQRGESQVPGRIERAASIGGGAQPGGHGDGRHAPHDEAKRPALVLLGLGVDPVGQLINRHDFIGPLTGRHEVSVDDRMYSQQHHDRRQRKQDVHASRNRARPVQIAGCKQADHEIGHEKRAPGDRHDQEMPIHHVTRR